MDDVTNELMSEETYIKTEESIVENEYDDTIITETDPIGNENTDSTGSQMIVSSEAHTKPGSVECDICGRILSSKSVLRKHTILLHSAPGTIFCSMCGKVFSIQSELDEHQPECLTKKRDSSRKYIQKCAQKFTQKSEKKYANSFECGNCKNLLSTKWNLRVHMRTKHNSDDKIIPWKKVKTQQTDSNQDRRIKHNIELPNKLHQTELQIEQLMQMSDTNTDRKGDADVAGICQTESPQNTFDDEIEIKIEENNVQSEHEETMPEIDIIGNEKTKPSQNSLVKKSTKKPGVTCSTCGKIFANTSSIYTHKILKHSAPGTMFCSICAKLFSVQEELDAHYEICLMKKRACSYKTYLKISIRKFECKICKKLLSTKHNLRQHIQKTHNPYECYLCKQKFELRKALTRHMMAKHLSIARRFKCKSCSASFWQEQNLREHVCTNYASTVCDICGEILRKQSLRAHMITAHEGRSRTHQCDMCSATFRHKYSLTYHKHKKHDPVFEMFECDECSRSFGFIRDLLNHKTKVHRKTGIKGKSSRNTGHKGMVHNQKL